MATSYTSDIDALIRQKINDNQVGAITGAVLQNVLLGINDKAIQSSDLDPALSNEISSALPSSFLDSGEISSEDLVAGDGQTHCSFCRWEVHGNYITVSYVAAYGVTGWLWTSYPLPKAPLSGYEMSGNAILRLTGSVWTDNTWVVWVTKIENGKNVFAFRKNDGSNFLSGDHVNVTFTYRWK